MPIEAERPLLDIAARSPIHDRRPGPSCRPPTRNPAEVDVQPIYRSLGAAGEWVFSDRRPHGTPAEDLSDRYRAKEQFARVQVRGEGSRFPARIHSVIGNDVQQMSRILRDALDLPVRQIDLDIVLYGDRKMFLASSGDAASLSRNVQGFYQRRTNRVAVLDLPGFEATRQVARHEASHAMLAGMYGATPVWLNEGLAEVMTRLEVTGQLRELSVHPSHAATVRRQLGSGAGALARLLHHDHASWGTSPPNTTYPLAWSLVHELLRDANGRALLRAVFDAQEAAPCRPIDSEALVQAHYPGGFLALEERWLRQARAEDWGPALRF